MIIVVSLTFDFYSYGQLPLFQQFLQWKKKKILHLITAVKSKPSGDTGDHANCRADYLGTPLGDGGDYHSKSHSRHLLKTFFYS